VWAPDSRRIFFTSGGAIGSLFEQSITGEQGVRLVLQGPEHNIPTSVSPDGRFLVYTSENIGSTRGDVWVLPLVGDRTPYPLIRRAFDQEQAQFSPDGRWIAYVSNESGRQEVLVHPFSLVSADDPASVAASNAGGTAPRWSADGKELFFITLQGAIASVPVSIRPAVRIGSPTVLFQAQGISTDWGVAADGRRFLVMAPDVGAASTSFSLILDWRGTLDRQQ
jgi:Tol biopolymer transport system component